MTFPPKPESEFDRYAGGYDGGLDNPVKRLLAARGETPFVDYKVSWLRDRFPQLIRGGPRPMRLLDFGCGTGDLLASAMRLGITAELTGCDISSEMIAQAFERLTAPNRPRLFCADIRAADFPREDYDIVVICCVLHHVEPDDRADLMRRLARLLVPGGWLVIFEHNPWHPLVQWVVRHTEIDRNAKLLSAPEARRLTEKAGFVDATVDHFLFGSPHWKWMLPVERRLRWLPCGGQYAVAARTPV